MVRKVEPARERPEVVAELQLKEAARRERARPKRILHPTGRDRQAAEAAARAEEKRRRRAEEAQLARLRSAERPKVERPEPEVLRKARAEEVQLEGDLRKLEDQLEEVDGDLQEARARFDEAGREATLAGGRARLGRGTTKTAAAKVRKRADEARDEVAELEAARDALGQEIAEVEAKWAAARDAYHQARTDELADAIGGRTARFAELMQEGYRLQWELRVLYAEADQAGVTPPHGDLAGSARVALFHSPWHGGAFKELLEDLQAAGYKVDESLWDLERAGV